MTGLKKRIEELSTLGRSKTIKAVDELIDDTLDILEDYTAIPASELRAWVEDGFNERDGLDA